MAQASSTSTEGGGYMVVSASSEARHSTVDIKTAPACFSPVLSGNTVVTVGSTSVTDGAPRATSGDGSVEHPSSSMVVEQSRESSQSSVHPTTSSGSSYGDLLKCSSCSVSLEGCEDPPLMLTACLHTVCQICVQLLSTAGGAMECKLCGVISSSTRPHTLASYILFRQGHPQNQQRVCGQCEERGVYVVGTVSCCECSTDLCTDCEQAHRRTRATWDHKIELHDNAHDHTRCSQHNKLFNYYCDTCNTVCCVDCILQCHRSHVSNTLEAKAAEMRALIATSHERIKSVHDRTARVHTSHKKNLQQACDNKQRTMDQICSEFDNYQEKVRQFFQSQRDLAAIRYDTQINQLQRSVDRSHIAETRLRHAKNLISHLENAEQNLMIVENAKYISSFADSIEEERSVAPPAQLSEIELRKVLGFDKIGDSISWLLYDRGQCIQSEIKNRMVSSLFVQVSNALHSILTNHPNYAVGYLSPLFESILKAPVTHEIYSAVKMLFTKVQKRFRSSGSAVGQVGPSFHQQHRSGASSSHAMPIPPANDASFATNSSTHVAAPPNVTVGVANRAVSSVAHAPPCPDYNAKSSPATFSANATPNSGLYHSVLQEFQHFRGTRPTIRPEINRVEVHAGHQQMVTTPGQYCVLRQVQPAMRQVMPPRLPPLLHTAIPQSSIVRPGISRPSTAVHTPTIYPTTQQQSFSNQATQRPAASLSVSSTMPSINNPYPSPQPSIPLLRQIFNTESIDPAISRTVQPELPVPRHSEARTVSSFSSSCVPLNQKSSSTSQSQSVDAQVPSSRVSSHSSTSASSSSAGVDGKDSDSTSSFSWHNPLTPRPRSVQIDVAPKFKIKVGAKRMIEDPIVDSESGESTAEVSREKSLNQSCAPDQSVASVNSSGNNDISQNSGTGGILSLSTQKDATVSGGSFSLGRNDGGELDEQSEEKSPEISRDVETILTELDESGDGAQDVCEERENTVTCGLETERLSTSTVNVISSNDVSQTSRSQEEESQSSDTNLKIVSSFSLSPKNTAPVMTASAKNPKDLLDDLDALLADIESTTTSYKSAEHPATPDSQSSVETGSFLVIDVQEDSSAVSTSHSTCKDTQLSTSELSSVDRQGEHSQSIGGSNLSFEKRDQLTSEEETANQLTSGNVREHAVTVTESAGQSGLQQNEIPADKGMVTDEIPILDESIRHSPQSRSLANKITADDNVPSKLTDAVSKDACESTKLSISGKTKKKKDSSRRDRSHLKRSLSLEDERSLIAKKKTDVIRDSDQISPLCVAKPEIRCEKRRHSADECMNSYRRDGPVSDLKRTKTRESTLPSEARIVLENKSGHRKNSHKPLVVSSDIFAPRDSNIGRNRTARMSFQAALRTGDGQCAAIKSTSNSKSSTSHPTKNKTPNENFKDKSGQIRESSSKGSKAPENNPVKSFSHQASSKPGRSDTHKKKYHANSPNNSLRQKVYQDAGAASPKAMSSMKPARFVLNLPRERQSGLGISPVAPFNRMNSPVPLHLYRAPFSNCKEKASPSTSNTTFALTRYPLGADVGGTSCVNEDLTCKKSVQAENDVSSSRETIMSSQSLNVQSESRSTEEANAPDDVVSDGGVMKDSADRQSNGEPSGRVSRRKRRHGHETSGEKGSDVIAPATCSGGRERCLTSAKSVKRSKCSRTNKSNRNLHISTTHMERMLVGETESSSGNSDSGSPSISTPELSESSGERGSSLDSESDLSSGSSTVSIPVKRKRLIISSSDDENDELSLSAASLFDQLGESSERKQDSSVLVTNELLPAHIVRLPPGGRSDLDWDVRADPLGIGLHSDLLYMPPARRCESPNNSFCSFCWDGGDLVLCDFCTKSYHTACYFGPIDDSSERWQCLMCMEMSDPREPSQMAMTPSEELLVTRLLMELYSAYYASLYFRDLPTMNKLIELRNMSNLVSLDCIRDGLKNKKYKSLLDAFKSVKAIMKLKKYVTKNKAVFNYLCELDQVFREFVRRHASEYLILLKK